MSSLALREVPVDDAAFREIAKEETEVSAVMRLEQLLMRKICDPAFLPSHYDIHRAFGHGGFQPGGLSHFCWKNRNEVVNREFIAALSGYLAERICLYSNGSGVPIRVVEVGAGKGQLGYFLQRSLDRLQPDACQITATDNGASNFQTTLPVECLDAEAAITAYQPTIVISSWMPLEHDWTPFFRRTPSVREYILIGETASCGKAGEAWRDKDGFEGMFLEDVSRYQICHLDQIYGEGGSLGHQSVTYSFRRM